MWEKEIVLISLYTAFAAASAAFALHWLMQDGHPLQRFREWIETNLTGDGLPDGIGANVPKWQKSIRYTLGMWLGGCSVCQSFWFAVAFSVIFTSLPFTACVFTGFMAMTLTYKIY